MKKSLVFLFSFIFLISFTSAGFLNSVELSSDSWYFNNNNTLIINTYDFNNSLIDVESINVSILENITYDEQPIYRVGNGTYEKVLSINKTEIDKFDIKVVSYYRGDYVYSNKTFYIEDEKFSSLSNKFFKEKLEDLLDYIEENLMMTFVWLGAFFGVIVIIILVSVVMRD